MPRIAAAAMTGLTVLATACPVPGKAQSLAATVEPAILEAAEWTAATPRSARLLNLLQVLETLRQTPVELAPGDPPQESQ